MSYADSILILVLIFFQEMFLIFKEMLYFCIDNFNIRTFIL